MKRSNIIRIMILAIMLGTVGCGGNTSEQDRETNFLTQSEIIQPLRQGGDFVRITYEVEGERSPSQTDMNDTIFKLQQRIENVTIEASVYQEGSNRIIVEIPNAYDAEEILAELGRPGFLYFISYKDPTGKINYSLDNETGEYVLAEGVTIEDLVANGSVVVTGTEVASAKASTTTGDLGKVDYVVLLTLNNSGAEGFANATRTAAANGWTIAIYYDGRIISAPRVNAAITDGSARITGMGSMETAKKLASNIRIGSLKLTLNEVERCSILDGSIRGKWKR